MEQLLKFVILLLVIIVIILLHISIILKKKFEQKDKKPGSLEYSKVLPQYRNRKCEITVKEPMPVTNVMFSEKGIVLEADDNWLLLEVEKKKGSTIKIVNINNITGVKEIV